MSLKKYRRLTWVSSLFFMFALVMLPGSRAFYNNDSKSPSSKPQDPTTQDGAATKEIILPGALPSSGTIAVLVQMEDEPAGGVYSNILRGSNRPEAKAAAVAAARTRVQSLRQKQASMSAVLRGARFRATEIYRVQRAVNGIAVEIDASKIAQLRSLPGVKAVIPIQMEYPTSSTGVGFLGTQNVWGANLNLNAKGDGIKIGVIDTGIDYQHADFGGSGLLADYQANNRTVAPDAFFPSAKVVGGTDFAGDSYNGSSTPAPDSDPMDCNGHGSHVAGIAAGLGVNGDGTTFAGPYNEATNFSTMRIPPGVAPGASLYAIRVFGCGGGTNLTVQGIDWAMNPNGDSDFSDHMDIVNMSLGSSFGTLADTSAIAADAAAEIGVVMVVSAGNSGDTYFIHGSPATGNRVISVAAAADGTITNNTAPTLRVNSPAGIAGFLNVGGASFGSAPPSAGVTGTVIAALDTADGAGPLTTDGCSPILNAAAIAGNIAFVDRGTCGFTVKAKNAQNAGAIGVIVANNASAFGIMGGTDPTVIIPAVLVTQTDGNTLRSNLGSNPNVTLFNSGDIIGGFSSRGPRLGSAAGLKPDITAPGVSVTSIQSGITCDGVSTTGCLTVNSSGFLPNGQSLDLSGTSMAAPYIAGTMALLRQLHPDWSVEELKALAMNGAIHDTTLNGGGNGPRYGLARQGAGRVDPANSGLLPIVAYNADDAGQVSLTFNSEIVGTSTQTKNLRIVNPDVVSHTYDLGIDNVVDVPGVNFSLPGGSSLTIPAGQSIEIPVQMTGNAALITHPRDLTVAATQAAPTPLTSLGSPSRFWLTEKESYVTFSEGPTLKLRVPVYSSPRGASTMAAASTITTGGAPTGSTTMSLSGTGICTGTLGAGPTCTGTFPTDEVSLVTPFELQAVHPRDPSIPGYGNIQYGGVTYDSANNIIYFGISTWDNWSSLQDVSFNVVVDADNNGTFDRVLFTSNPGTEAANLFGTAGVSATDSYITSVFTISTSGVSLPNGLARFVNRADPATLDTAAFNNNVIFFGAAPSTLGLATATTTFKYKIVTCPGSQPLCGAGIGSTPFDTVAGPFTWNTGARGLNFGNTLLMQDLSGASIPVTWNTANMTTNSSLGALLLHHQNATGNRPQIVTLDTAQTADLGITYSSSTLTPTLGQNVTLTTTVTNNGPNDAAGVSINVSLPAGLTYVSDDGGGDYNPGTRLWSIGTEANGITRTLHIVATVNSTDPISGTVQIGSTTPTDSNLANNQASISLQVGRAADLSVNVTAGMPSSTIGSDITFTATVTNIGDDPAYNVQIALTFPGFASLHATSGTPSHGVFSTSTGIWSLATLPKGATETLTIHVTAPTAGSVSCQATVSADTADLVNGNNASNASTTLSGATIYTDPAGTCGGNTPCVTSIQTAIDTVGALGTVNVGDGTYNESINLNQDVTVNFNGVVTINSLIFSTGTINGGSATINDLGIWSNDGGTFNAQTSTVVLNGVGTQAVRPSDGGPIGNKVKPNNGPQGLEGTNTFSNLVIDDPAGVIFVGGDQTVTGTLTLTQGILDTNGNTLIIASTGSIVRTADFILGTVTKQAISGSFSFPMGDMNGFTPLDVANASGGGDFTVLTTDGTAGSLNPATTLGEFWTLTATGSVTLDMTFNYLPADVHGDESQYRIIRVESGIPVTFGTGQPNVSYDTAQHKATITGVSQFSDWTLGQSVSPTAVTFESFTATASSQGTSLQWKTGFEVNNLGFNVYRQVNGQRVQINPSLIAGTALMVGSNVRLESGYTYNWLDEVSDKSTGYWLEDVDISGNSTWHGPFGISLAPTTEVARTKSVLLNNLTNSGQRAAGGEQSNAIIQREYPAGSIQTASQSAGAFNGPQSVTSARTPNRPSSLPSSLQKQWQIAAQPAVKIAINKTGWYRVSASDLAAAGLNGISSPAGLQMFVGGVEVPIKVNSTDGAHLDSIEFYGIGLDTTTTDTQVYWLTSGLGTGKRIAIQQSPGSNGQSGSSSFQNTVERKDRSLYFSSLKNGDAENWFGPVVAINPVSQTINIHNHDVNAGGQAQVEIALQGVTTKAHQVTVSLNGQAINTMTFNGMEHPVLKLTVPESSLSEGDNQITFAAAASGDVSLIDYVRVTYAHTYVADNNGLFASATGNQPIKVTGFTSNQIRAIDVASANQPIELVGTIDGNAGNYSVTVDGAKVRNLLVFAPDKVLQPVSITSNQPATISNASNGADFVIITNRAFAARVQPLADLRQSQGYRVSVIDVDNVYDEFSYGVHSPQAVKDFLNWTYLHWQVQPQFVMFAGSGTLDPRNYTGEGFMDFVPTKLIDIDTMETASDDWFVDFKGDGKAQMSVGRLPVNTVAEATIVVNKILAYGHAGATEGMVLVSDLSDGTNFTSVNSQIRAIVPSNLSVTSINRTQTVTDSKFALLEQLNNGGKIFNYAGHGSVNLWRGGLLTDDDMTSLANHKTSPLVVIMSCLNGYFQDPKLASLGESLLKVNNGGAVSVWASSGMTDAGNQTLMNQEFFRQLFNNPSITLGEAIKAAKSATGDKDIRKTWILFGDPTMRIQR